MLTRLAATLLVVLVIGSVSGCGSDDPEIVAACGTSMSGIHEKGPLQGTDFGGNAPTMVRAGKPTPQPALRIPLVVEGNQPVTIDCVHLDPFQDMRNLPAPALPHLEAAHVVTAEKIRTAKGFRLDPETPAQAPWLLLSVSTQDKIAFNQDTQVFYHTPDGTRYRTVYLVQFVVCVKGEVAPRSCLRAFPRYVKRYDKEQQRLASSATPSA
jgi:hypothetical protein